MARAEIGTAKHQAKKLKAAGLQKLRFYCQICEKQCRDANGFRNHLSSPSHRGKVSSADGRIVEKFSSQFKNEFVRLLRVNHGTKPINANKFYQEYITGDRDHVHMNLTKWSSLTSFVKYLGQNGIVRVHAGENDDEYNLEISYVGELVQEIETPKLSDDEIAMKLVNARIRKGQEQEKEQEKPPVEKKVSSGPVKISLKKEVKKPRVGASVFD